MSKNLSKQQNLDLKIYILNVVVKVSFFMKLLRIKLMLILTISRLTPHISPKFIKLGKVVLTTFLTKFFNKCILHKKLFQKT